jgi:hypothetical protein
MGLTEDDIDSNKKARSDNKLKSAEEAAAASASPPAGESAPGLEPENPEVSPETPV